MKTTRPRTKSKGQPPKKKKKNSIYLHYGSGLSGTTYKTVDFTDPVKQFDLLLTQAGNLLNGIAAGDASNQRDGIRTRYKSIEFRGNIVCAPFITGFYDSDLLRFVIVYDKTPNGASPPWSNVGVSSIGFPNLTTRERFLIIHDETVRVPAFNATVAAAVVHYTDVGPLAVGEKTMVYPGNISHFYKSFNLELDSTWIGSGGAIANLESGGFFLYAQSKTFAAGNCPWFLDYATRIHYTDASRP